MRTLVVAILCLAGCGGSPSGSGTPSSPSGGDPGTTPPAGDPGATPSPDLGGPPSTTPPGGGGTSGTEYAPYFYSWGWGNAAYPFTSLVDLKTKAGTSAVTIAFVLSSNGCAATHDIQDHRADVDAFRAAGGHVKASFGGADGTYLENACSDDAALAAAIGAFVDATGVSDLDFDVEQPGAMTTDVNAHRGRALALVQKQHAGVRVAFTLPSIPRDKWNTPGGLQASALDVVVQAHKAGVAIAHVNLMTMDFGGYYSTGHTMAELAESAATDCAAELVANLGVGDAQAWAMVGITPMIGVNDVSSEVFKLDDATNLVAFAKAHGVGLLAFWAINRDQPCASQSLALCSEANTSNFQFNAIFDSVR
ncbi:MAG: Chitinase [bacterium]|nr:Chitinase [bacterium]